LRKIKALLTLLLVFLVCFARPCNAQFVSVSAGGLLPHDRSVGAPNPASSSFNTSWQVAADGGVPVFPFVVAAVHYSYARPGVFLAWAGQNTALFNLAQHNLVFEGRLRTPTLLNWRFYALAGVGFSHFSSLLPPCPSVQTSGGTFTWVNSTSFLPPCASTQTKPMFTFGGGIEHSILPLLRLKIEARDYVTSGLESLLMPGGAWHRTAVLGGIVVGR
jgi:hypothetical protein